MDIGRDKYFEIYDYLYKINNSSKVKINMLENFSNHLCREMEESKEINLVHCDFTELKESDKFMVLDIMNRWMLKNDRKNAVRVYKSEQL